MIPIEKLSFHSVQTIPPGTIALRRVSGSSDPLFVAIANEKKIQIPLQNGSEGLRAFELTSRESRFLCIEGARFLVDESSCFGSWDDEEDIGCLFLSDGKWGLLSAWMHRPIYIGLNGEQLPEPSWGEFVGFRSWRVEFDVGADKPITIFERTSPKIK